MTNGRLFEAQHARATAYAYAANAAAAYANRAAIRDRYLSLMATLALEVLTDLQSPGAVWLQQQRGVA